jgi:hypothetical protein
MNRLLAFRCPVPAKPPALFRENRGLVTTFKIAHIKEQGQDMIIVPVNATFGRKSSSEQRETMKLLGFAARQARLTGTVVTIWSDGNHIGFIAPPPWHPFLRSSGIYDLVMHNINRELSVPD